MSCFDLGGWLICQSLRLTVFLWSSLSFAFEDIINQRTYTSIMGQAAESLNLPLSGSFSCQANEKFAFSQEEGITGLFVLLSKIWKGFPRNLDVLS